MIKNQTSKVTELSRENHFINIRDLKWLVREGNVKSFADFINYQADKALEEYCEYRDEAQKALQNANAEIERLTAMSQGEINTMFSQAQEADALKDQNARVWLENELNREEYILSQIESCLSLNYPVLDELHRIYSSDKNLTQGAIRLRNQGICLMREKTSTEYYEKLLAEAQDNAKSSLERFRSHKEKIDSIQKQRKFMLENIPVSATLQHDLPVEGKRIEGK